MYQLIKSVEFAHKKGVIHLDIKQTNIIINKETKKLNLIDFGSSEFFDSTRIMRKKGSLVFESPEMLLAYDCYDYTADSWTLGTILGGMMFKTRSMFEGDIEGEILADIMTLYDQ